MAKYLAVHRSRCCSINRASPPNGDPRTPDIIVVTNTGVVYTGKKKKVAEHGGFAHDDTNVMLLLANPDFSRATIKSPVENMQIAPTILQASI